MAQFSRLTSEIDAILDDVESAKGESESLTAAMAAESEARTDADTALQTAVDGKAAVSDIYGLGANIYATQASPKDLDSYTTPGRYYAGVSVTPYIAHKPASTTAGFQLTVEQNSATTRYIQTITYNSNETGVIGTFYKRWFVQGNVWSSWYKFEGTVVT